MVVAINPRLSTTAHSHLHNRPETRNNTTHEIRPSSAVVAETLRKTTNNPGEVANSRTLVSVHRKLFGSQQKTNSIIDGYHVKERTLCPTVVFQLSFGTIRSYDNAFGAHPDVFFPSVHTLTNRLQSASGKQGDWRSIFLLLHTLRNNPANVRTDSETNIAPAQFITTCIDSGLSSKQTAALRTVTILHAETYIQTNKPSVTVDLSIVVCPHTQDTDLVNDAITTNIFNAGLLFDVASVFEDTYIITPDLSTNWLVIS